MFCIFPDELRVCPYCEKKTKIEPTPLGPLGSLTFETILPATPINTDDEVVVSEGLKLGEFRDPVIYAPYIPQVVKTISYREGGPMDTKERIFKIGRIIADVDGFELVFNEEPDSAHFLKRDGERFGRDLELYNFMADVTGLESLIAIFLEEVVLPSGSADAITETKNWGLEIYPTEKHQQWMDIFDSK